MRLSETANPPRSHAAVDPSIGCAGRVSISDACFASLVGDERNGHWTVKPLDCSAAAQHRYRPDTLIVERDFIASSGAVRVVDFMPMREGAPTLVRRVQGMRGSLPMKMLLSLRFDYGSVPPWIDVSSRTDSGCAHGTGPSRSIRGC